MEIIQYKFEKVKVGSKEFIEPTEPCYFFETGIRRSIRISPIYTTWQKENYNKDEEIYQYDITCVYLSWECKVEKFSIPKSDLSDLYYRKEKYSPFVVSWIDECFNERTKEQFDADLSQVIEIINK